MSLLEAAQMCETMAADAGIGRFIPTFGNLVADKERGAEPVSGAWVFRQFTKDRRKYKFNIAFTENTATLGVLDDPNIQRHDPDPDFDPKRPWRNEPYPNDRNNNGGKGKVTILNPDGSEKNSVKPPTPPSQKHP